MNFIWDKLTEWIRELLIEGIMNNLTGLFDQVNTQISGIADNVGKTPDRKSTRLNSSHWKQSRMPSSA